MCGNGNHNGFAAPIFRNQFVFSKLLFNVVRVCTFTVHFVNSNNDRYLRCFSVVNCFDGLGHYAVICCNYKNSNVSYLRTTSTHCGERFVTGGVKEYDLFALVVNFVRTDVLGNTASFACSNVGFTDSVQQRGFTVVNVTHNSNYRRTQYTFFWIVFNFGNFSGVFIGSFLTDFYAKFFTDKLCGFEVNVLVNGNHHTKHEESFNNLANLAFNQGCKFFYVNSFADFYEGRSNDFYCRLCVFRLRIISRTFFHVHLMTCATVRTAFLSSVGALHLLFILIAVFIAVAVSSLAGFYAEHIECRFRTAFATRLLGTALLRTCITATIFVRTLTARLLTFRTNEDAALTILLRTVLTALTVVVIAETTLTTLAIIIVAETTLTLGTVLTTLTVVVIAETALTLRTVLTALAIVVITETALTTLTIVVTETTLTLGTVLSLTVIVVTILLRLVIFVTAILLGLIISVCYGLCSLFGLLLLLNRSSLLRLFFLHRRLLFFRKCFSNNFHFLSVYATKVGFFDIVFLQNINDFIAAFANLFSYFIDSFTTHSSTS